MTDRPAAALQVTRFSNPGWRGVCAVFALNGFFFGVWASRIPALADRFALSEQALSWVLLGLAGGAILSFSVAGALSDRIGAAVLTRFIACAYAPALVAIAFAPSLGAVCVLVVLFGACFGSMDVAMNAWGAEVETAARRPVMSGFHAMFSLGAGVGAGSGALAAAAAWPPHVHFLLAASALPVALWLARHPHPRPERRPRTGPRPALFALPHGRLVLIGLIAFSVSLGEGSVGDWSAVFLIEAKAASEPVAALGFMFFNLTMVATRLSGDFIVTRLGPTRTVRISSAVAVCGVLTCVLSVSAVGAIAGFALMGVGLAVVMPLAFSAAARDETVDPGRALASVATLGYGGMLLGPVAIGMLAERVTLEWAFLLIAALCVLSFALAPRLRA